LYLAAWIEFHPHRADPNAPLWTLVGKRARGEPMSYAASHRVLKTAAKRAGIKKRVHAQLFRHIMETELARKVREASWEDKMVKDRDSEIAKAFVQLPRGDADKVLLGAEGTEFLTGEEGVARELPKACPRCEAINQHDSAFCRRCGLPLTLEALEEPGSGVEKMQGPPEAVVAIPSRAEAPAVLTQLDLPVLLLGVLILFLGIFLGPPYSTFSNIAWLFLVVGGTLTAINVIRGY
ncbi:MAG: site-specific integrase, partial [candidate division NC10 bacterium]